MPFASDELALLDQAEEIEIETARPEGPTHRATIWVVVDDGDVFIRSVDGSGARWYREATSGPSVTIHVGGRALSAHVERATDPDAVRRTSDGYARKYASQTASVRSMLKPEILDATLRLTPA